MIDRLLLPFDLKSIEALAPDQASLSAASKLTKRSTWARLEQGGALLWGECQGSGANPYRVVVDTADQGYKCTCPSRKFPCKHSLALMWISATVPDQFVPTSDIPEWVNDWMGRRRRGAGGTPVPTTETPGKNIATAGQDAETQPSADESAKRAAAQKKRQEETRAVISSGLDELDQWISDQLRLGLASFVDAAGERCRRIAARLVDARAAGLASRIDELPAFLLGLRAEERPEAAIRELGKLALLTRVWRQRPEDAELKRLVGAGETREQVLTAPDSLHVSGAWEVLGERIETRRDGLVSHATWLIRTEAQEPRFALLQDFYPASAGRRAQAFSPGERFTAELVFYPARVPLRALIVSRSDGGSASPWAASDEPGGDPLRAHVEAQHRAPWMALSPLLLGAGHLARDAHGRAWWQADEGAAGLALPVEGEMPEPVFGMSLRAAAGLWNGAQLHLLAAQSDHGRLDFT